jgi:hypothetical protein
MIFNIVVQMMYMLCDGLQRYFSFRLPHLNIPTGPHSDELDNNSQRAWLRENLSHWVDVYLEVRKSRGHIFFE